jgi:hypothetical protein
MSPNSNASSSPSPSQGARPERSEWEGRGEGRFALWGHHLLWALALAGLALLAGFTVWFCIRALGYRYQLLYGEGFMLEFARRLAAGEPLYKPLAGLPLGTVNYPPLPLLLARLTFPLTGFGYAAGRLWAILGALGVAAILFAWVRRATGQIAPAAASALAWLGAPYVYHWAPQFRVDLPGLALSLAGLYLVWRLVGRDSTPAPALFLAAPLFVLGLYCKQSFVAAPAAAVLVLLLSRRYRQALLLAGLILVLGGIPFLALNIATGGAFWNSLVTANVNLFHLDRLVAQLGDFVRTYLPLLGLSALWLAGRGLQGRQRERWTAASGAPPTPQDGAPLPTRLVAGYLVLALLTVVLAGKAGAWENYFLEPLAALCLAGGLALALLQERPAWRWAAPLLLLLQVALMWHTPSQAVALMRADTAANQALGPRVAATPGLVLSEDAGLLVQAGKPVPYYDFPLTQLALTGRWDQSWEIENLRQGAFLLVVFEDDPRIDVDKYGRYTRAFMSALDYGYRLVERVGKYSLYRPAPLARERIQSFVRGPQLVGHTLSQVEVQPGQPLSLDIVWQATEPMTQAFTSFLHLDANGQRLAGDDRQPWSGLYPTSRWAPGEMVRMSYTLTLPADLPPGLYALNTGWYDASHNRLHTHDGADQVVLAVVVAPTSEARLPLPFVMDARFENGMYLVQYDLVRQPDSLELTLGWETERPIDKDYTVFVHLRDRAGDNVSQGDAPPLGGAWPTSLWPTGYLLQDPHTVPLPAGLQAGRYEVVVGLYDRHTDQRVPLAAGGDELPLEEILLP